SMSPQIAANKKGNPKVVLTLIALAILAALAFLDQHQAIAGEVNGTPALKVLEPIRHGNLTVFPIVASRSYPRGEFLTLDEGLRSGDVIVTEYGNVQGLVRRRTRPSISHEGAQVNKLVLINNSKR